MLAAMTLAPTIGALTAHQRSPRSGSTCSRIAAAHPLRLERQPRRAARCSPTPIGNRLAPSIRRTGVRFAPEACGQWLSIPYLSYGNGHEVDASAGTIRCSAIGHMRPPLAAPPRILARTGRQGRPATPARDALVPGRPGALLRRAPLRTRTCGFHRIRLKQALMACRRCAAPGRCLCGSRRVRDGRQPRPTCQVPVSRSC